MLLAVLPVTLAVLRRAVGEQAAHAVDAADESACPACPTSRPWPSSAIRKITGPGNEIGGGTPEEFAAFITAESKRWSALVKSAGIKLD